MHPYKLIKFQFLPRQIIILLLLLTHSFTAHARSSTYETIEKQISELNFKAVNQESSFSYAEQSNQDFFWLKGQLRLDQLDQPMSIQIPSPRIHQVRLYIYKNGKLQEIKEQVSLVRYDQFSFETDSTVYYLRSRNALLKQLPLVVMESHSFYEKESKRLLRIGLYYGLGIMSIIFNFVFFLIFKDKRFIAYCFLQIGVFIEFFYEDGMFYYLSSGQLVLENLLVYTAPISAVLACIFAYYFLDLKHTFKKYWLYITPVVGLMLLSLILFSLFKWKALILILDLLSFFAASIAIGIAIARFKRDVYARFLVLTFGTIVIFGIGFVLNTNLNLAWLSFFDMETFRMVSAFEIISISFAITFKARALQEENERNRTEINKYLIMLKDTNDGPTGAFTHSDFNEQNVIDTLKVDFQLTDRETEVLLGIWEGLSNQELADKLFISLNTIKYHIGNLYVKLDVKTRTQAVRIKEKINV